jgi:hypothetical protein
VISSEATRETAMFKGMIDAIVCVTASRIVTDPLAVGMDVRRFGMSVPIIEMSIFLSRPRVMNTRRTMSRDVLTSPAHLRAFSAMPLVMALGHG